MGWAFRDLSLHDDDDELLHPTRQSDEELDRELTHTALDERVKIPREFVAPHSSSNNATASKKPKKKTTTATPMAHSTVYSKHASSKRAPTQLKKPTRRNRSRSPDRLEDPADVDFVYDLNTRRALRERMDAERIHTLHKAVEKETQLRADHKWISDGTPPRKQAWQTTTTTTPTAAPHTTQQQRRSSASGLSATPASSSQPPDNPRKTKKSAPSTKTSIAPNVSEWRTQQFPVHACATTEHTQRRRHHAQRQQQQQRVANELVHTIEDFEHNLKQWTS